MACFIAKTNVYTHFQGCGNFSTRADQENWISILFFLGHTYAPSLLALLKQKPIDIGKQPIRVFPGNLTGEDRVPLYSPKSPSPDLINTRIWAADLRWRKEEEEKGRWWWEPRFWKSSRRANESTQCPGIISQYPYYKKKNPASVSSLWRLKDEARQIWDFAVYRKHTHQKCKLAFV